MKSLIQIFLICFLFSAHLCADELSDLIAAAERGNARAQWILGFSYYHGEKGVPQNHAEAARWYRKAAEQGDARAQHALGDMYLFGKGVSRNDAEAAKWYRKAAEQGDARAQYALGGMSYYGGGVPQDYSAAYIWLNLATASDYEGARELRDLAAAKLSPEALGKAQQKASELYEQIQRGDFK